MTVYAFGGEKEAKVYGEFLDDVGIKKIPVWVVNKDYIHKQGYPFARQMWLGGLTFESELGGNRRNLHYGSEMCRGGKVAELDCPNLF
ncbi:hypothetical protein ES703_32898 [subsurface metagenome]